VKGEMERAAGGLTRRESVRPQTRRATEQVQSEERACEKSPSDLWPLADWLLSYSD